MALAAASLSRPSWAVRTGRFTRERFPLALLLAILALYALAAGAGVADAALADAAPAFSPLALLTGAVAVAAWFLMIRTLDDLEDEAADAIAHPERALQRGVVSRSDLLALIGLTVALQAAAALATDRLLDHGGLGPITALWLGMAAFLALLAVDFGAPRALAARPGLRRALRAPASVLPVVWAFWIGWGGARLSVLTLVAVVAVAGVVAWYDISRRDRPAQEPVA